MNGSRFFSTPSRRTAAVGVLLILTVLLTACGGAAGDSWSGISSTDGIVLVSLGKTVKALDAETGSVQWTYPDKDDRDAAFYAIPVMVDGTIYVGDYKGRLHAINSESGSARWVYEPDRGTVIGPLSTKAVDRVISGVAVEDGKIFFGLGSSNVVAISESTGEEIWTFETDHGVWATPFYLKANDDTPAALYVVSLDQHLYALNPDTGDKLWSKDLGGAAPGGMTYDEGRNRLYIGTFLSELLAVDLATHEIVSRFETENWLWGHPALEEDILYFGDLSGNLYAVRITDEGFERLWQVEVADGAIRSTPLILEDQVVVGSKDKKVYAVNKDNGTGVWDVRLKGEVLTEVIQPGSTTDDSESNLVIVGTSEKDDRVVALRAESGDVAWRHKAD